MSKRLVGRLARALAFVLASAGTDAAAQDACRAVLPPETAPNIFSAEQERTLGDAMVERLRRQHRVIADETLLAPLRATAARLTAHLPPPALPFTVQLIEAPTANAWVLPGGAIFVTRKMVALARTEDELAGVLAHEIGHLMARQQTVNWTRWLKDTLGVTSLGDRADVLTQYNRLMDAAARGEVKSGRGTSVDDDQIEADRLGLFLARAAGYDSAAFATIFERLVGLSGSLDSGFFADLFGRTSPDVKRWRALSQALASLPASCAAPAASRPGQDAFEAWKTAVVSYTGRGAAESLTGVRTRSTLAPGLQGDLTSLRFSPDGRFVLAQDTATLSIISREPFRVVFSIDAPGAIRPAFTPDSQRVVFHTADLRVQVWSIAERRLLRAEDVMVGTGCADTELSPDGTALACLERGTDLVLFDVATSERLFEQKAFYSVRQIVGFFGALPIRNTGLTMAFSPNGRYFAAGYHDEGSLQARVSDVNAVAIVDLESRRPVPMGAGTRRLLAGGFTFTSDTEMLAVNIERPRESGYVSLPSGEVARRLPVFRGQFVAATRGPFAVYRPFDKYAVAVYDLNQQRIVKSGAFPAVDLYDDVFVAERSSGELALYAVEGNRVLATTTLPRDDLEPLRGGAISPDLKHVALSGNARGAIWDATTGQGIAAVPAFSGGRFAPDGHLYVDVRPLNGLTRQIARLDAPSGRIEPVGDVPKDAAAVLQVGDGLMSLRMARPDERLGRAVVLEMRTAATLAPSWTRVFPGGAPRIVPESTGRALLYLWPVVPNDVRADLKGRPDLLQRLDLVQDGRGYLLDVRDVATGRALGHAIIEAPAATFLTAVLAGDRVFVSSTDNRVRAYSITAPHPVTHTFGRVVAASESGERLAVENGEGRLLILDAPSMQVRQELAFRRGVALARFSPAGEALLVVTRDQVATVLDVTAAR